MNQWICSKNSRTKPITQWWMMTMAYSGKNITWMYICLVHLQLELARSQPTRQRPVPSSFERPPSYLRLQESSSHKSKEDLCIHIDTVHCSYVANMHCIYRKKCRIWEQPFGFWRVSTPRQKNIWHVFFAWLNKKDFNVHFIEANQKIRVRVDPHAESIFSLLRSSVMQRWSSMGKIGSTLQIAWGKQHVLSFQTQHVQPSILILWKIMFVSGQKQKAWPLVVVKKWWKRSVQALGLLI